MGAFVEGSAPSWGNLCQRSKAYSLHDWYHTPCTVSHHPNGNECVVSMETGGSKHLLQGWLLHHRLCRVELLWRTTRVKD